MYYWGLTIDVVSCNTIIISVGLCVDFSAHIAHSFMMQKTGNRNDRVRKTLYEIGPAVLNGGFSTFLAFSILIGSKSYVFRSFFKIFVLIVGFGLYNGLIALPILLSLVGPAGHRSDQVAPAPPPDIPSNEVASTVTGSSIGTNSKREKY